MQLSNHRRHVLHTALLLSGTLLLSQANPALARSSGISGYSGNPATNSGAVCSRCHSSGSAPQVVINGPASVEPGTTNSYTLTMTGGPAVEGAFDISASDGTLIDTNPAGTKMLNGEIVHSAPHPVQGGAISWTFDWQAPTTPGDYTLYGSGLSTDGNFGTSGDGTGAGNLTVSVAAAPVNEPPLAAITAPVTAVEGDIVSFDASGSSDPDGTIASYTWDFGDGTSGAGMQATHSYLPGSYTITLTVTDNDGATGTTTHALDVTQLNQPVPPIAAISGPTTGVEGTNLLFSAANAYDPDGTVVSYAWDFGDGTTATGMEASHNYAMAGNYTVTLTVTDNSGDTASATLLVTITAMAPPEPPVAVITGPTTGVEGMTLQFSAANAYDPDGTITDYHWDFGDSVTATGMNASHAYSMAGSYTVTLTVSDNSGDTGTATQQVTITSATMPGDGETLYQDYCSSCHGTPGSDDYNLEDDTSVEDIYEAIMEEDEMQFLNNVLSSDNIKAISDYLEGFGYHDDDEHDDEDDEDDEHDDDEDDEDEDDDHHDEDREHEEDHD